MKGLIQNSSTLLVFLIFTERIENMDQKLIIYTVYVICTVYHFLLATQKESFVLIMSKYKWPIFCSFLQILKCEI